MLQIYIIKLENLQEKLYNHKHKHMQAKIVCNNPMENTIN